MTRFQRSTHKPAIHPIMQLFVGVTAAIIIYRVWNGSPFLSYAGMLPSLLFGAYWLATGKSSTLLALAGLAGSGWHMYYAGLTFAQIAFYILLLALAFWAGYAPIRRPR